MLKELLLRNFRNYSEVHTSFSEGVNWITGMNGHGKTNLLEAIYLLCTGRSFRTRQLKQLIKGGEDFFYIEALFEKDGVDEHVKVSFDGEHKKVVIGSTAHNQLTPLLGYLPHVLYAPEDILLATGGPAERRKFMDLHLSMTDHHYLKILTRYLRAVQQRNTLIKEEQVDRFHPWEVEMATASVYLMEKRQEMINALQEPLGAMVKEISSDDDPIEMRYHPSHPLVPAEDLVKLWEDSRERDLAKGYTSKGPHRDDIDLLLDNLSVKIYASQGQRHTVVAALRMCVWQLLKANTGKSPLFSIDDFGAHLDEGRQQKFQSQLYQVDQLFLTSPYVQEGIFPEKNQIEIGSGKVLEVSRA